MSQAERKTWSADTSDVCCLCGMQDTKSHRLFDCEPLACIREPHIEVLDQVKGFRPWWVHMLAASEHEDLPMFRLLSTTRTLPMQLPPPDTDIVQIFTDGSARHSSCGAGVPGLKFLKIKAHNDKGRHPSASPYLQWSTAGNEAADAAARQARAQEMRLVRDLSDIRASPLRVEAVLGAGVPLSSRALVPPLTGKGQFELA